MCIIFRRNTEELWHQVFILSEILHLGGSEWKERRSRVSDESRCIDDSSDSFRRHVAFEVGNWTKHVLDFKQGFDKHSKIFRLEVVQISDSILEDIPINNIQNVILQLAIHNDYNNGIDTKPEYKMVTVGRGTIKKLEKAFEVSQVTKFNT